MNRITLINVYDDEGHIIKQAEAKPTSIRFGAVRKIMKLLQIENANDTWDIIKIVSDVWDELTALLSRCFPEMEDSDWDKVKLEDLIPAILAIVTSSFNELSTVPQDPEKN